MSQMILTAPCHFGLESVLKKEITDLGYDVSRVEDGRVSFTGDEEAICLSNIHLRTAERILIEVGRFNAYTFDELFEKTKALSWEDYIPKDGR
ncbi:MAG TPA: RNA methyltransferase, partial [Lachnospiraceae bacterium]|nr:RNA methyltransferase [Lachnospiraceae bacterium]